MAQTATVWQQREVAALTLHEQERLGRQLHDTVGPQADGHQHAGHQLAPSLKDGRVSGS